MSSLWIWLRRLFLGSLWLGVLAGAVLTWRWGRTAQVPRLLGVPWTWMAAAALVGMAGVALDAVLELPLSPPPPIIPPAQEIARWGLFLTLGLVVAGFFALDAWLMRAIPLAIFALLPWLRRGEWPRLVYFATVVGVIYGTFWALILLEESGLAPAIRHTLRYRLLHLHTSEVEILGLLEATDLPEMVKEAFADRIRRHGMTPEVAENLLRALEAHSSGDDEVSVIRAMLTQNLYNWLEEESLRR